MFVANEGGEGRWVVEWMETGGDVEDLWIMERNFEIQIICITFVL